ncbi:hypothetical protein GUITHDRAFT_142044 [Guillardia theta CCMP2712]|uniref:PDZ domain-containing protein n=1 Tax=Guillardia theta (strain CCMP2712) TaxID=905079 RepID=L1IZM2_GUITC|nr:hypothetical protein GUITHDRAFT_142044 [Guillardia theta CCMP2712]EKX41339.1 hypothetical protein GUITHDRAFT_142044 [Guillardia theta CCMP2712]|eukprot:XP_005828319.1 hypothetical protein GUITHDRAFT_142044 [Guillardia theta CCMP2712]
MSSLGIVWQTSRKQVIAATAADSGYRLVLVVSKVLPGSPAAECGKIRAGDKLIAVQDESPDSRKVVIGMSQKQLEGIMRLFRSTLIFEFLHATDFGSGKSFFVQMRRNAETKRMDFVSLPDINGRKEKKASSEAQGRSEGKQDDMQKEISDALCIIEKSRKFSVMDELTTREKAEMRLMNKSAASVHVTGCQLRSRRNVCSHEKHGLVHSTAHFIEEFERLRADFIQKCDESPGLIEENFRLESQIDEQGEALSANKVTLRACQDELEVAAEHLATRKREMDEEYEKHRRDAVTSRTAAKEALEREMYVLERQMAELDDEEEKLVAEIEATSQEIDKEESSLHVHEKKLELAKLLMQASGEGEVFNLISHVCEFTGKPPEFVEMFLQDMEMDAEIQRLREREEALSNKLEQLSEEENVRRPEERINRERKKHSKLQFNMLIHVGGKEDGELEEEREVEVCLAAAADSPQRSSQILRKKLEELDTLVTMRSGGQEQVETASNSGRRDVQLLAEDCQEALKVERERKKMARRRHQEERKG